MTDTQSIFLKVPPDNTKMAQISSKTNFPNQDQKDESKSTEIDHEAKCKSIMKPHKAPPNERKDRFGIAINEIKRHKVSFRDEISGKTVQDTKLVESYKEFNKIVDADQAGCECLVL